MDLWQKEGERLLRESKNWPVKPPGEYVKYFVAKVEAWVTWGNTIHRNEVDNFIESHRDSDGMGLLKRTIAHLRSNRGVGILPNTQGGGGTAPVSPASTLVLFQPQYNVEKNGRRLLEESAHFLPNQSTPGWDNRAMNWLKNSPEDKMSDFFISYNNDDFKALLRQVLDEQIAVEKSYSEDENQQDYNRINRNADKLLDKYKRVLEKVRERQGESAGKTASSGGAPRLTKENLRQLDDMTRGRKRNRTDGSGAPSTASSGRTLPPGKPREDRPESVNSMYDKSTQERDDFAPNAQSAQRKHDQPIPRIKDSSFTQKQSSGSADRQTPMDTARLFNLLTPGAFKDPPNKPDAPSSPAPSDTSTEFLLSLPK